MFPILHLFGRELMACLTNLSTPAWNTYFGRDLTGFMRPLSLSQSVYTVQSLVTQQLCSEALYTFLSASSALSFDFEPLAVQRFYNVFLQSRATAEGTCLRRQSLRCHGTTDTYRVPKHSNVAPLASLSLQATPSKFQSSSLITPLPYPRSTSWGRLHFISLSITRRVSVC